MSRKPKSRSADSAVKPPVIELEATEVSEAEPDAAETPAQAQEAGAVETASSPGEAAGEAPAGDAPGAEVPEETPGETAGEDAAASHAESDEAVAGPAVAPSPRRGRGRLIAGAVVLGLVAAAAAGALLYRDYGARFFPSPQATAAMQALETRLAAVEAAEAAAAGKARALEDAGKAAADELARTAAGLTGLADGLKALQGEAEARTATIEGLQGRLGDLEARADRSAGDIAGLKTALAAAAKAGSTSSQTGAASALQIGELSATLDTLGQRVKALEDGLGAARDDVAGLASKLDALASRGSAPEAGSKAAQLTAAFSALETRIAEGKPFAAEVDTLAGLDPNLPGLQELRELAGKGVPGVDALTKGLAEALATLGAGAKQTGVSDDDGWMVALKSRVFSVVKIRKIGEVDWTAAGAVAETALERGDLDAAMAAFGPAGAATPEPIAAWLAAATARQQALARLSALSAAVFQSIKRNAS